MKREIYPYIYLETRVLSAFVDLDKFSPSNKKSKEVQLALSN